MNDQPASLPICVLFRWWHSSVARLAVASLLAVLVSLRLSTAALAQMDPEIWVDEGPLFYWLPIHRVEVTEVDVGEVMSIQAMPGTAIPATATLPQPREPSPYPHAWVFAPPLVIWLAAFAYRRRFSLSSLFLLILAYAVLCVMYGLAFANSI